MARYEFRSFKVTVTTAGTPVPLVAPGSDEIRVSDFEIYIPSSNTGAAVYVGYEGFSKTNWMPRPKGNFFNFRLGAGHPLREGEFFSFQNTYLDSDSNGDVAYISYFVQV